MSASAENSNVKVVVRIRPSENLQDDIETVFEFQADKPELLTIKDPLSKGRSDHSFLFSKILLPETSQDQVFEAIARPLVNHVMQGFNACCFAYGQTGSGKTYSTFGEGAGEARGLIPRGVEFMFERINQLSERKEIGMVCSFIEIYLDQIRDMGRAYMADR